MAFRNVYLECRMESFGLRMVNLACRMRAETHSFHAEADSFDAGARDYSAATVTIYAGDRIVVAARRSFQAGFYPCYAERNFFYSALRCALAAYLFIDAPLLCAAYYLQVRLSRARRKHSQPVCRNDTGVCKPE